MATGGWTRNLLWDGVRRMHNTKYSWDKLPEPLARLSKAAVLVPLVIEDGQLYVWLTERSQNVTHDKGHVSFPGGMRDAHDTDAVDTCLREAEEEIGLERSQVEVVGELLPFINYRQTLITPIIGLVSNDFQPKPNTEVVLAFRLPLARFLSSHAHWTLTYGENRFVHFFRDDVKQESITTWGLTASVCIKVACVLLRRGPDFQFDLDGTFSQQDPWKWQMTYLESYTAANQPEGYKALTSKL